ncbi:prophage regulatory protein [Bradyrhizobium sp. GM24.11]
MSARKLLLFPELRDHGVPFGRRYIDRLEAEGKIPKRVPIGTKRVGWIATEIEGWVSAAIARRSRNVATQVVVDSVA